MLIEIARQTRPTWTYHQRYGCALNGRPSVGTISITWCYKSILLRPSYTGAYRGALLSIETNNCAKLTMRNSTSALLGANRTVRTTYVTERRLQAWAAKVLRSQWGNNIPSLRSSQCMWRKDGCRNMIHLAR